MLHGHSSPRMKPEYFGDSYDHTKKFLLGLAPEGVRRIALPMLPDKSDVNVRGFLLAYRRFLDVQILPCAINTVSKPARSAWIERIQGGLQQLEGSSPIWLFADPCTGVVLDGGNGNKNHLFTDDVAKLANTKGVSVMICYDQSFSRDSAELKAQKAQDKLRNLRNRKDRVYGFYYCSHASFLIASNRQSTISRIHSQISGYDFDTSRLVCLP